MISKARLVDESEAVGKQMSIYRDFFDISGQPKPQAVERVLPVEAFRPEVMLNSPPILKQAMHMIINITKELHEKSAKMPTKFPIESRQCILGPKHNSTKVRNEEYNYCCTWKMMLDNMTAAYLSDDVVGMQVYFCIMAYTSQQVHDTFIKPQYGHDAEFMSAFWLGKETRRDAYAEFLKLQTKHHQTSSEVVSRIITNLQAVVVNKEYTFELEQQRQFNTNLNF